MVATRQPGPVVQYSAQEKCTVLWSVDCIWLLNYLYFAVFILSLFTSLILIVSCFLFTCICFSLLATIFNKLQEHKATDIPWVSCLACTMYRVTGGSPARTAAFSHLSTTNLPLTSHCTMAGCLGQPDTIHITQLGFLIS